MEERLNKWLSRMGVCSRREADRLIEEGKILVDGRPAVTGQKVSEGQSVVCGGRIVGKAGKKEKTPRQVLLAVNKPRGIVCTTSYKDRAQNIVEFLAYPERIYPIGRLDKDSQGLLLMTNQGDLVNKIMRCGNGHEKEYEVTIDRPVTEEFLEKMASGLWLAELERKTLPCRVRKTGDKGFSIILTQGLNRQIRRMCEACGCHVRTLKRMRIMNIRLGNLKEGSFREITGDEYRTLLAQLEQSNSLSERDLRLKNK